MLKSEKLPLKPLKSVFKRVEAVDVCGAVVETLIFVDIPRIPKRRAYRVNRVRAVVEHEKSVRRNQSAEHIYARVYRLFERVFDFNPHRPAKALD